MNHDDLDHILSKEQELVPSSGFVDSVMNAVLHESAAPAPIPFPWKRALPGLAAAGVALLSVAVFGILLITSGEATQPLPLWLQSIFAGIIQTLRAAGVIWIALALAVSLASTKLSMRFAVGRHS